MSNTAVGSTVIIEAFRGYLEREVRDGALSPVTGRGYARYAERVGRDHPGRDLRELRERDLRAYYDGLRDRGLSAKSVREIQIGLRRLYRWMLERGYVDDDPTRAIKLLNFKVNVMPAYSAGDVKALRLACNERTKRGARDAAMVMMLFDSGVRAGELCSMKMAPTWRDGVIEVSGKTGRRMAYYGRATTEALGHHIITWGIKVGEPLWPGKYGPLTPSGCLQIVKGLCEHTGVDYLGVHAFRRGMAVHMAREGADQVALMRVGGWKTPTMVLRYTASANDELGKQAHSRYSPGDALVPRRR